MLDEHTESTDLHQGPTFTPALSISKIVIKSYNPINVAFLTLSFLDINLDFSNIYFIFWKK